MTKEERYQKIRFRAASTEDAIERVFHAVHNLKMNLEDLKQLNAWRMNLSDYERFIDKFTEVFASDQSSGTIKELDHEGL